MDIFTDSRNSHLHTADSTNQQINRYATGRSMIQCRYDRRITQRIHLCDNTCRNPLLCMLCFSFNQLKETVFHPDRSHDQTIPAFRFRISGKHIKHCRRILSKTLVAGKNTAVCIQLGCRIIVVTGRQMHIAADAGFFSSDNQSDLAVCLKPYQTVDNMAACFFQHLRPDNVVLLIKSGLKFYQN